MAEIFCRVHPSVFIQVEIYLINVSPRSVSKLYHLPSSNLEMGIGSGARKKICVCMHVCVGTRIIFVNPCYRRALNQEGIFLYIFFPWKM